MIRISKKEYGYYKGKYETYRAKHGFYLCMRFKPAIVEYNPGGNNRL